MSLKERKKIQITATNQNKFTFRSCISQRGKRKISHRVSVLTWLT